MAYIYGDRHSRMLFPSSVDEYINEKDPVRVYDAFIESINLEEYGITLEEDHVGPPAYDPRAMLKLLVYGTSYGIRSSRKLERACHHNLSFRWLMGDLKPDHKTIARFRRENTVTLKLLLRRSVEICLKLKLIDGNVLFVDGSKFRANASLKQIWTKEKCKKYLERIDERINELLESCERTDNAESAMPSLVELESEIRSNEKLQEKIKGILKELEENDLKYLNSTDKDCVKTKGRQGCHAGYNAQIVTDGKMGLVVNNEVVSKSNDYSEFSKQVQNAEEMLGKKAEVACADSGYNQVEDLEKIASREGNTKVVVPSEKQVGNKKVKKFDKSDFTYDKEKDEIICPIGKRLKRVKARPKANAHEYHMKSCSDCLNCIHFGDCTSSKKGRTITRLDKEELKEELERVFESDEGQKFYRLRKQKVELPFGHFKRNLNGGYFLLRGRDGVNAEMSLLSTSFNITRMITLFGVPTLAMLLLNGGI